MTFKIKNSFYGLLTLFFGLLILSCSSKPERVVMGYIKAHNAHDVEKVVTFFADSADYIWENGWLKTGIKAIREIEEYDAYTRSHFKVSKAKVSGDTLFLNIEESNDFYKMAGLPKLDKVARFIVKDSKIIEYKFIITRKSFAEMREALQPFREWAQQERANEFGQLVMNGEFRFGYNGGKRWMALMEEWRKTVEQPQESTAR